MITQKSPPRFTIAQKMEESAQQAKKEFQVDWSAQEVAQWYARWTAQAGYKRLSRILLSAFNEKIQ